MNQKNRKIIISTAATFLLILLYLVIFNFSGQDGDASGSLSLNFSERCAEILNSISGKRFDALFLQKLAVYFEHPIRKFAHFSEYALMGILIFVILFQWKRFDKFFVLFSFVWIFVSALLDEIHQYFVPGRYSSMMDVCLDSCGGMFGILLCYFIARHHKRKNKKKIRNSQ
ncbi:VanZ family protein [Lachnospiraceae bacterium OttesenSCG-928-D06]|nr:VanZ family protein [Lachnospiraceae bacterium OttesenSCG-928-D06]